MSLPLFLEPKKTYYLKRLGKNNDGGYLVGKNSLEEAKYLISFGISDDWSFENDFMKINKKIKVFSFDNQLNIIFLIKKILNNIFLMFFNFKIKVLYFNFINLFSYLLIRKKLNVKKKKISYGDLNLISKDLNYIYLKIDIEGSEYRILEDILKIQNKIVGLVIEFHDIDLHLNKIEKFILSLNLTLVHIHPNNFSELDKLNNPTLIELTFEMNPEILKNEKTLPHELDQKCNPKGIDIKLNFS